MLVVCRPILRCMLLVLLLATAVYASPAHAATAAPQPSASDLSSLVETLQDPAQRHALIGEIKTLIALRDTQHATPLPKHESASDALDHFLSSEAMHIGTTVTALAQLSPVQQLSNLAQQIAADPQIRMMWARGAFIVLTALLFALAVGRAMRFTLQRPLRRLHETARGPFWLRILSLCGLLLLSWVPVLVLLAAGYTALAVGEATLGVPDAARALVLAVLNAYAFVRVIGAVTEAFLAPDIRNIRFLSLREDTADYWLVWTRRLTRYVIYGWFALAFASDLDIENAAYEVCQKAFGLGLSALIITLILQNRMPLARIIQGRNAGEAGGFNRLRDSVGNRWHIVAILYVIGTYGIWASDLAGGFAYLVRATAISLVTLALARAIDIVGVRLVNRFLNIAPELEQRLPGLQKRVNLYTPVVTGSARVLLYMLAALLALQAWGIDILAELETSKGQQLIGGFVTICVCVAMALAIWESVSITSERYLLRNGPDGMPLQRSARIRTLLPLFRKSLAILLGSAVTLISLATVGVNIGPLLAGAGILGIAVGFGAQSLVKDVINGIFVLMQDAVAVGDVVAVAGNSGLVEKISIRSIRLRDQSGTVIIIPFSEVTTVQNMTKDFSYALFDIGIAYREDVDKVIAVINEIADTLQADKDYSGRILEPIEVLGLDKFADSAVIIKARIKTKPIQQWSVMREYNRRMKRRFDELGIEIPFPHQTIYFGTDREGNAPAAHLEMKRERAIPRQGKPPFPVLASHR